MKNVAILMILCGLMSCGSSPAPEPAQTAPAPPPAPRDDSNLLPEEGLISSSVAAEHVLDKDYLPGGTVGEYERDGKNYSVFLINLPNPDRAGMLAYDVKERLADAKFVASFGGYFGMDGDQPWFIFPRKSVLVGVVGLPEEEADLLSRELASHIY